MKHIYNMSVEEFIKSLLEDEKDRWAERILNTELVPYIEENYTKEGLPKDVFEGLSKDNVDVDDFLNAYGKIHDNDNLSHIQKNAGFDKINGILEEKINKLKSFGTQTGYAADLKDKELYYQNNYDKTPSIYTSPNAPYMTEKKDSFSDLITKKMNEAKSNINNVIDWAKKEPDVLKNNVTDYSKPMIPHEKITDTIIKNLKPVFPVASDMYTDGMTNFSRAKKNPNAEIININDIKDENMKQKIKEFGTKENERGVHYNTNSEASKIFSNSSQIQNFYKQNKDAIKRGEKKEYQFDFSKDDVNIQKPQHKIDKSASIQHGTLINPKFNSKNQATGEIIDRSDFERRHVDKATDIMKIINNHGFNMQEKGNYENYFSIIDILSDVENQDKNEDIFSKLVKILKFKK